MRAPIKAAVREDELHDHIAKDIHETAQRDRHIAQLEDADRHHAEQAGIIRRSAAHKLGRPRKTQSELVSDVASAVRHRVFKVAKSNIECNDHNYLCLQ